MNGTDLLQTVVKTFYLTRPSFLHIDLILIDRPYRFHFVLWSSCSSAAEPPSGWLIDRAVIVWTDSFERRWSRGLRPRGGSELGDRGGRHRGEWQQEALQLLTYHAGM